METSSKGVLLLSSSAKRLTGSTTVLGTEGHRIEQASSNQARTKDPRPERSEEAAASAAPS